MVKLRTVVMCGAVSAALLAGCAHSASITIGDGRGSKFCNDVSQFEVQAIALDNSSSQGIPAFQAALKETNAQLATLQADVNPVNKVNGHLVKDDLALTASIYGSIESGVSTATTQAEVDVVLQGLQAKQGQSLTQATDRLDAYAHDVCALKGTPTTTTAVPGATSTTVARVGPVVSTTAAP